MLSRGEFNDLIATHLVAQDWVDLRDLKYRPSLTVLHDRLVPGTSMDQVWPGFGIRNQGQSGRCVGYALANLVDLHRRDQWSRIGGEPICQHDVVSADMLYFMATYHDAHPQLAPTLPSGRGRPTAPHQEGIRTLRSAIKALYHHGVCRDHVGDGPPPESCWPSDCHGSGRLPTVAQAKAARAISLGAYYRLDPILNDYHAALNEARGVLVSAMVHGGWRDPFQNRLTRIGHGYDRPEGAHAFVIVGYDQEGFLVLNSWGDEWGGYADLPGVALWPYADWAETVMDGWVLRLGVSAPDAFDVSIGRRGLARMMGTTLQAGSARCHQLIGHYLHLDDGFHVDHGSYPSDRTSWPTTQAHLKTILSPQTARAADARPRKGLLLWIPGSLEGIDPAVNAAVQRKATISALDLYPYNIFWCNQFIEKSLEVLTDVFESCHARVGSIGPQLDALIESQLRGIGRAFWRDIEQAARRAVHGTPDLPEEIDEGPMPPVEAGPVVDVFRDMLELGAPPEYELHVVCEGAGVLLLHEFLRYLSANDRAAYARLDRRITSLSLIHPAIGLPRAARHILPLVERLNQGQAAATQTQVRPEGRPTRNRRHQPPRARIYLPSTEVEARLCFGVYDGSLLQLVSRAFEDRLEQECGDGQNDPGRAAPDPFVRLPRTHPSHPPRPMLGMQDGRDAAVRQHGPGVALAFSELTSLAVDDMSIARVTYESMLADPLITAEVFRTVEELRRAST